MQWRSRFINIVLVLSFLFSGLSVLTEPVIAAVPELFFSEYVEGSSNNKALEIYNPSAAPIDLDAGDYIIEFYFNGSSSAGTTIDLTGTVPAGDVFVVADNDADAVILDVADLTSTASFFNGNDCIALRKAGTLIDFIGEIGEDEEWGSGLTSTQDNTLRRKEDICEGDTNDTETFDPAVEWDGYAQNTFDGLGTHYANCDFSTQPKINEFSASTTGDDVEFIEIYADPDTDYSAYTLLEIEGDSGGTGVIDEVIEVGTTDANGFFLINLTNGTLENGSISILLVEEFTGVEGEDIDADDDGVIDYEPWDEIVDTVAVNDGGSGDLTYGTTTLNPNYDGLSTYAPGGASRIPDGYDTESPSDWVRNDFDLAGIPGFEGTILVGEAYNTPGATNQVEGCGGPITPIFDIQGSGMTSPMDSADIITEGIVVGDFQDGKSGFFLQDAVGDGDPSTSDGIFVHFYTQDVQVGDKVRVAGTVDEYYGLTEITNVSNLIVCSSSQPLPAPVALALPVTSVEDFEPFEGMYVTFPQDLVISEYFNFDRYNEIVLTTQRYQQFTAVNEPDAAGFAASNAEFDLNSIILDDGRTASNPDPAIHPNSLEFSLYNRFRGGDLLTNVTGVIDYSYGEYLVQPTEGADYTAANPRPATPDIIPGDIKIASLNVYNYFTTIDTGDDICGPSAYVDVIGKIGEDPGAAWGTEPVTTQDDTLTRKESVCYGDINAFDTFDPALEWDGSPQDTFTNLGSHTTTCGPLNDLIISEYIEGSSSNKAIEIFNGTGAAVDLQGYKVVLYTNGSEAAQNILEWDTETLLADGEVYVIANPSADTAIKDVADIESDVTFFNGDDVVALQKAGAGNAECRGADTPDELERQRAKIIAALAGMDADVVGLMEIENDRPNQTPDYAVADLVSGLNDLVGAGTYDYIPTGAIGTDAIKVAMIFKPANVTPFGLHAILDTSVDSRFLDSYNRPVLAQSFTDNLVGESFTVAVNHLKSKGSECDAIGDFDQLDGQGNCNQTRLSAAQAEVDWLASDPTKTGVDNIVIIGDLNSYDKEDPIDAIKAGADDTSGTDDDYYDMIFEVLGEGAYGYVFDGRVGYLDYALVSANLLDFVTDVTIWHINADEPDLLDYDMSFKKDAQDAIYAPDVYRSSDHDPVIMTLTFNQAPHAVNDYYQTGQDTTLTVPAPGVLTNDEDRNEFDRILVDLKTAPLHGELTLNEDGSFVYTPYPFFFGLDVFVYDMIAIPPDRLENEYIDTATVFIWVKPECQLFFPLAITP